MPLKAFFQSTVRAVGRLVKPASFDGSVDGIPGSVLLGIGLALFTKVRSVAFGMRTPPRIYLANIGSRIVNTPLLTACPHFPRIG
jgi:hypothetical protein